MKKVEKDYRPSELEDSIRAFWAENNSYRKTREWRSSAPLFSFIDGPPYTTGSVHVGTAWNKILKDLFLRYKIMRGFNVRDQPGYDMHGLPIEVRVEQTIGTKNKADIEVFGVEKFIEKCKSFAIDFRSKQTEEFKRLGVWMDWDNPYQTIDRSFISSVWWTIGEAYKRELVTKANRVLPWCPRCETALAEAEIEYWDEKDPSIYVKFPLIDLPDESIVIWTTTPWTIPGNVAAAVHPKEVYARVQVRAGKEHTEVLIVMKSLVDSALPAMGYPEYRIIGDVLGQDLLGKKYRHPLLETVPAQKTFTGDYVHAVVVSDTVAKENTGIVHIAPGHGPEDFEIGKEYKLPVFCPVDGKGMFTADAGDRYAGRPVHEGGRQVLNDLQDLELLVKESEITHRFGHCWRCKTPIIYRTTEQWFLQIPAIKEDILRSNESVKWYPEWAGSSRQKDWIVNARDWCISRQRYWGTPLPIWVCSCGELKVLSGYDDLRQAEGFYEGIEPHRPWIDRLTFSCPKCSGKMTRVPDVVDVWIDSGACSWASMSYPDKRTDFEKWWPVEWITEAHDQTRGWFYSQLVLGTIVFGKSPFKSVLMHGWALDQQGKPMSKSEGNAIDPMEVIKSSGADALRLYLLGTGAPWDDMSFQPDGPKQANRFLNIFWNVYKFALLYMAMDAFDPGKNPVSLYRSALKPEDRWVLSRLERVKGGVTAALDVYQPHEAARQLEKFITDDLSRWYVRLIRDRLWIEGESVEKMSAFAVLYEILDDCISMIAPFAPHIAEEMYRNIDGILPSVHMTDWPVQNAEALDDNLEQGMEIVREIVEKVSNARQTANLNLRWPLKRIIIKAETDETYEKLTPLKDILLEQVNAKDMHTIPAGEEWEEANLEVVPNPNAIGKTYRQWSSKIAVLLKSRPAKSIKDGIDRGEYKIGIEGQTVEITHDMVSFTATMPPDVISVNFSLGAIYVDTELTPELEAEGFARETVRRIQQMRKEMKLDVEEYIELEIACGKALEGYLTEWRKYLMHETRAQDVRFSPAPKGEYVVEWSITSENLTIGVSNLKVKETLGELAAIPGLPIERALRLNRAGFTTLASLSSADDSQLLAVSGVNRDDLLKIHEFMIRQLASAKGRPHAPAPQAPPQQVIVVSQEPQADQAATKIEIRTEAQPVVQIAVQTMPSPPQPEVQEQAIAAPSATQEPPTLEKSLTYLVEEDRPETSYKLFIEQLNIGKKGFCITRNYPAKIKARFRLGDIPLFWLSNVGKDNTIRPKDLEKLNLQLEQFLSNNDVIILLDGLEYLITNNSFATVMRLLQSLKDQVAIHQSILVIAVNPSTLESHQLNLLEKEIDRIIKG
jgi:isoleucyl-tRNA synthetase